MALGVVTPVWTFVGWLSRGRGSVVVYISQGGDPISVVCTSFEYFPVAFADCQ